MPQASGEGENAEHGVEIGVHALDDLLDKVQKREYVKQSAPTQRLASTSSGRFCLHKDQLSVVRPLDQDSGKLFQMRFRGCLVLVEKGTDL